MDKQMNLFIVLLLQTTEFLWTTVEFYALKEWQDHCTEYILLS